MTDEQLDEMERQTQDAIRLHRECYEKAIKPLIERLIMIQGFRRPVFLRPIPQGEIVNPHVIEHVTEPNRIPSWPAPSGISGEGER